MAVLPTGIGPVTGGYQIARSLRFNSADSAYLNRTPASVSADRTRFTFSCWLKRGSLTDSGVTLRLPVFGAGPSSGQYTQITTADGSGALKVELLHDGAVKYSTLAVLRDPSAWCHLVVQGNSNETVTNRIKIWVNNVQYTTSVVSEITSADVFEFGNTVAHYVGKFSWANYYFDGYLTEINFIDGQAKTPSDFGETDSNTGVWKPKAYSGTYGTNGFHLKFADNSGTTSTTLGKDSSGNGNNWTPNGFVVSPATSANNDSLVDSPTAYGTDTGVGGEVRGNYCTWNRLQTSSSITLNNGNLDGTISGGFLIYSCAGTIEVTTSKWYYETVVTAGHSTAYPIVGVCDLSQVTSGINTSFYSSSGSGDTTGIIAHATGTNVYLSNNTSTTDGVSYNKTTDVLMIAFDADLGKVWFGKNGTWNNSSNPATNTGGHTFSTVSGKGYRPYVQCNADTSNSWTSNFGQRAFAYTAPSGFKALCTQNLPTPTIGATSTTQADNYFSPVLYTGTGSTRSITSLEFQPDFTWIKPRSAADYHILYDAVRGVRKQLYTSLTNAEETETQGLSAFLSNGFTLGGAHTVRGQTNDSGVTYVSWNWNAGGSTVTNTTGSISAQVRANTTSGFSIVTYTGTGASATVGHGLGVQPGMVIVKDRSSGTTNDWRVWHRSLTGGNNELRLNTTAFQATDATTFSSAPSSTVINYGNNTAVNGSSRTYVAYCFAPVTGYSAFGSYEANNSADGVFVYLGFRPEWIMFKRSSTGANSWVILDSVRNTYNVTDNALYPNQSYAENATLGAMPVDFLSNGFKTRTSNSEVNGTGTYIYAAFAESPFKYSLAR